MAPGLCGAREEQATGSGRASTTDTETPWPRCTLPVSLYALWAGGELWQHPLTASMAQAGKFLQQGLTAADTVTLNEPLGGLCVYSTAINKIFS